MLEINVDTKINSKRSDDTCDTENQIIFLCMYLKTLHHHQQLFSGKKEDRC